MRKESGGKVGKIFWRSHTSLEQKSILRHLLPFPSLSHAVPGEKTCNILYFKYRWYPNITTLGPFRLWNLKKKSLCPTHNSGHFWVSVWWVGSGGVVPVSGKKSNSAAAVCGVAQSQIWLKRLSSRVSSLTEGQRRNVRMIKRWRTYSIKRKVLEVRWNVENEIPASLKEKGRGVDKIRQILLKSQSFELKSNERKISLMREFWNHASEIPLEAPFSLITLLWSL